MCPRVSATCDFIKPVTFGDELDVHTWISKKGRSSIVFECSFKLGEEEVARGRVTAVFVSKVPDGKMKPVAMPERFDRLFEVAPFAPKASAGYRVCRAWILAAFKGWGQLTIDGKRCSLYEQTGKLCPWPITDRHTRMSAPSTAA